MYGAESTLSTINGRHPTFTGSVLRIRSQTGENRHSERSGAESRHLFEQISPLRPGLSRGFGRNDVATIAQRILEGCRKKCVSESGRV